MASTSTYKCDSCSGEFVARTADRARGWARFCSKSCKAVKQTQNGNRLQRKSKHAATHAKYAAARRSRMSDIDILRARALAAARSQGVDIRTWLEHRLTYGGNPQFDRNGSYVGFSARFVDKNEGVEYDDFEPLYRDLNIEQIDDDGF